MISADTMTGIASRLESMSHDACLGHNDVRMTPQAADALAKCIKDFAREPERPTCSNVADPYDGSGFECSRCGEKWELTCGGPADNHLNFCPMCGAEVES